MRPIGSAWIPALARSARPGQQYAQLRPCQPGIGSTGAIVAAVAGNTTVGVRLRLCTTADGMPAFWPLSSNLIGGPIMTWLAMSVARIACISAAPLVVLASLKPSAAISSASKVKPTLKHSTAKRKFGWAGLYAASSAWLICDFGSAHGIL